MASIFDDLAEGLGETASGLAGGAGVFVIVAIMAGVAFLSLVIIITFRKKFDFAGTGHQIGHYMIIFAKKYPIEVNLAEWDEIDDSDLDLLENSPEKNFEIYADVIRQMRKEKTIYIYTMKITDDSEVEDELAKNIFLISAYDLDDKEYYFESQKAKFTWRSFFQKDRTRVVETYSPVELVTVYNEDKNEDDWFFIVPVSYPEPKTNVVGFDSRAITKHQYYITPKQITNADKLAYGSSYMPYVVKTKKEFKQLIEENSALEELVEERSAEVQSKQQIIQRKNRKLGTKTWVVISKTVREKEMKINMTWVIGAVFIGGIFPKMLESYLDAQTALFIGVALAMAIIGLVYHFTYGRNKEKDDDEMIAEESKA